jgi:hypothetical protein
LSEQQRASLQAQVEQIDPQRVSSIFTKAVADAKRREQGGASS